MGFVEHYEKVISWIMWHAQFGPDKLVHTWVGLGFWLLSAWVLRRPLSGFVPLAVVVLLEGGNETVDYIHHIGWTVKGTAWDVVFTLFWPLVLTLALRWNRALVRR